MGKGLILSGQDNVDHPPKVASGISSVRHSLGNG